MSDKPAVPNPQRDSKPVVQAGAGQARGDVLPIKSLSGLLKPKTVQSGYGADSQLQGIAAMDASNKAAFNLFKGADPKQKAKREVLRQRLAHWIKHLENATGADAVVGVLNKEVDQLQGVLDANMRGIYKRLSETGLERSYREVQLLFENAKGANPSDTSPKDFSFIDRDAEQVKVPQFLEDLGNLLRERARDWKLDQAYSMLAVPGLLDIGGAPLVDSYAQICAEYQVQMFSDFHDVDNAQQVVDMMDADYSELRGDGDGNKHKRAASLVCNYLLGRAKTRFEADEGLEDVWLRPSMALVGITYAMDGQAGMQQPGAGKTHGKIRGATAVKFKVNTESGGKIEGRNVIPTALYGADPTFMGASTLFTGPVHSVYSIRRTLDYVSKNIKDFLNRSTFEVINGPLINGITAQISNFMEGLKKKGIIQSYDSVRVIADDEMRSRYEMKVIANFKPFFPVKYFDLEVAASNLNQSSKKFDVKEGNG